jgi:biotin operon repressor
LNPMDQRSNMSYQEYLRQQNIRQEQAAAQAQQAIQSAGLDSFSQQVNETVQRLRQVGKDIANAQNQLEMQMAAQQRTMRQIEQNIDALCNQLASSYKASSGRSVLQ